ncbi:E3 ubiquitin-protein ligase synoviolin B, partial [Dissostichus eleginoides]
KDCVRELELTNQSAAFAERSESDGNTLTSRPLIQSQVVEVNSPPSGMQSPAGTGSESRGGGEGGGGPGEGPGGGGGGPGI